MKLSAIALSLLLLILSPSASIVHEIGDGLDIAGTLHLPQVMNHGVTDETIIESDTSGGYASFNAIPNVAVADDGFNHLYGFQSRPQYSGTGTLEEFSGVTVTLNANGPVGVAHGMSITNPSGSGEIDTMYGILIGSLERAAHNFAIYTVGSMPSVFGGSVSAGSDVPLGSTMGAKNLPVYPNNEAALNGGLLPGAFYRSNANPSAVCVVY